MLPLKFTKMQALKNDFVIIDGINSGITLSPQQIKFICDRKLGVGCDQLLLIGASKTKNKAEFTYRIFNQDGSEAGQCGNGARCVIKYLAKYHNLGNQEIKLITLNGFMLGKQISPKQIIVDMGMPEFTPEKIPFKHKATTTLLYQIGQPNEQILGGAVSMGNPHFITFIDSLTQLNNTSHLEHMVNIILHSALFPEGVNINFCYIENRNNITIRTFERGCGWTDSCGSGSCASTAHGIQQNLLDNEVVVKTLGGEMKITWHKNHNLFLSGPAFEVFTGTLTDEINL